MAIHVEGLGKQYRIGQQQHYSALRDSIAHAMTAPVRALRSLASRAGPGVARDTIWALEDTSFQVRWGEVLGIVGRNGAGKSTLLKILARVTEPTTGLADVYGRVGSLLEVGTGFHPELTGRENVYLNAAILGMKRAEILHNFDAIVEFAEIEQFLDTPVKYYSSGMYLRLAFAVAAHLTPEILIVDEVLAVGDSRFQEKCLKKMGDVATAGRTVLFVSHNLQAVAQLTTRCIVLNRGKPVFDGPTGQAIQVYRKLDESMGVQPGVYENSTAAAANYVQWARVQTTDAGGLQHLGKPITFGFCLKVTNPQESLCFSFQIVNELQQPICHFWAVEADLPFRRSSGLFQLECRVPRLRLFTGRYTLTTWLAERRAGGALLERLAGICSFEVAMDGTRRAEYDWAAGECVYLEDAHWTY